MGEVKLHADFTQNNADTEEESASVFPAGFTFVDLSGFD